MARGRTVSTCLVGTFLSDTRYAFTFEAYATGTPASTMAKEVDVDVVGPLLAVRIVNPLHVLGNRISVSDIDGLKIFKLYEHLKSFEERKNSKARKLSTGLIGASQTVHRYNDDQKKSRADYSYNIGPGSSN